MINEIIVGGVFGPRWVTARNVLDLHAYFCVELLYAIYKNRQVSSVEQSTWWYHICGSVSTLPVFKNRQLKHPSAMRYCNKNRLKTFLSSAAAMTFSVISQTCTLFLQLYFWNYVCVLVHCHLLGNCFIYCFRVTVSAALSVVGPAHKLILLLLVPCKCNMFVWANKFDLIWFDLTLVLLPQLRTAVLRWL